jgi:hypothetical protein
MCWSAEVSAVFAATQWAGILWLWRRNEVFDRPFAIAISPIATQEALQWLLWEHISVSSANCDRVNLIGSLLIRQITGLVPLGWVWFAQRGSSKKRLANLLLRATTAFTILRMAMIFYSFYVGPTRCTTIGPGHHQAWAGYLGHYAQLQPALDIVFFSLYWMLPVGSLLLLFRPRWLAVSICVITVGSMVPCLWLYSPDELGSVWCWACSLLVGLALVYPHAAKLAGKTLARQ